MDLDSIATRHWGIIGCSARTGDGLLEGVDWIVKDIAGRLFTYMWVINIEEKIDFIIILSIQNMLSMLCLLSKLNFKFDF